MKSSNDDDWVDALEPVTEEDVTTKTVIQCKKCGNKSYLKDGRCVSCSGMVQ